MGCIISFRNDFEGGQQFKWKIGFIPLEAGVMEIWSAGVADFAIVAYGYNG
jgi:hypothetical protein